MGDCHERRFDVGPMVLSGIESAPTAASRGVVIALHGSGYTSRYWDCLHETSNSLLGLGRDLGFRVLAVDRPGYGVTRGIPARHTGLDAQAETLAALIARVHAESAPSPVFLIGHSFGSILVVRLAAREAASCVSGIDVTGLPVQWRSDVRSAVESALGGASPLFATEKARLGMYFGPSGTFDPKVLEFERSFSQRIPRPEMEESLGSAQMLREIAPLVRVPVQYTVAEFEGSIAGGEAVLAGGRSLFANAPRVAAHLQASAGHNVSLHRVGRAYHLRAFAFFEEILATTDPQTPGVGGAKDRVEATL